LRPGCGRNPEDDLDTVMIDLDPANDGMDDLAHAVPVELVKAPTDLGGKVLQSADYERQLAFGVDRFNRRLLLLLELRQAQLQSCNAGFELGLVDETAGVAVDETIDAAPNRHHLAIEPRDLLRRVVCIVRLANAPPELVRHAARILQKGCHLIPDHLLEPIAAHG
jgi:hypothetical protein